MNALAVSWSASDNTSSERSSMEFCLLAVSCRLHCGSSGRCWTSAYLWL